MTRTLMLGALLTVLPLRAQDDVSKLAGALDRFGTDVYLQLDASKLDPLCAPACLSSALLMLLAGTLGETHDELAAVLHLPADLRGERLHAAAADLLEKTALLPSVRTGIHERELSLHNDLWLQRGHPLLAPFRDTLTHHYRAEPHTVDFVAAPQQALATINQDIAKKTNDRIRDLLSPDLITSDTRLVLTSALWLLAPWLHPFRPLDAALPFHRLDGSTVDAAAMRVVEHFRCVSDDNLQILSLPYSQGLRMDVLLPRAGKPLRVAEQALAGGSYLGVRAQQSVDVTLPKFKVQSRVRLKQVLEALGLKAAFDSARADLSAIDGRSNKLVVEEVVHSTWITVDEKGTEAAAATAVVIKARGARPTADQPELFVADRPFVFAIRDQKTDLILFVGRVLEPAAAKAKG